MTAANAGFEFWTNVLQKAKHVVAPMVDQSELPWRMLSRRHGAQLCYTPMFHAANFDKPKYRDEHFTTCQQDRPLIVQFCANDPDILLKAAKRVAPHCDAVDINLGCPQAIAKKGHYGAFLQDEWPLLESMVSLLDRELSVPVTCKIRVFQDVEKTVRYAQMLEKAGCKLLTVHGRTREQRGQRTGLASWEHIRVVKEHISIPVFANGNIQYLEDAERCLEETGVEGIMSAECQLYNPCLFLGQQPPCWVMVDEYLALVRQYPCHTSSIRGHFFKLWLYVMKQPEYQCYRTRAGSAKTLEDFEEIAAELKQHLLDRLSEEELSADYDKSNIPFWRCQPYIRPNRGVPESGGVVRKDEHEVKESRESGMAEQAAEESGTVKKKKKREAESKNPQAPPRKKRWFTCEACRGNPKGRECVHSMCKICCKLKCKEVLVGCPSHRFTPRPALPAATPTLLPSNGASEEQVVDPMNSTEQQNSI